MLTATLYIVTGLTLYAGGHHLFQAGKRANRTANLQLGLMYLLLSGFALSSALAYQPPSLDSLVPAGTAAVSMGILLWLALVWFIAFRTNCKPLLLLDLITAVWLIFLVHNMGSTSSLMYTEPGNLMSPAAISPWWTAVEFTMLASLGFAVYATYQLYRNNRGTAKVLMSGLALLSIVTLFDHLVSLEMIHAAYLAPFGFLGFLAINSLTPLVAAWRDQRKPKPAPMIYGLSFKPDHASFHSDVSQLRAPLTPVNRSKPSPLQVQAHEHIEDVDPAAVTENELLADDKELDEKTRPVEPPIVDQSTLNIITDDLIDIAVYATMALNRLKSGKADPATQESLCKKIRVRAIKTRRLANQLSRPDKVGYDNSTPTDD